MALVEYEACVPGKSLCLLWEMAVAGVMQTDEHTSKNTRTVIVFLKMKINNPCIKRFLSSNENAV